MAFEINTPVNTKKAEKDSLIKTKCLVNGLWVNAGSGETFDVTNPANGDVVASVPNMNVADVRKAIDAANDAWPAFRDMTAGERANLLKKWHALIIENKKELATVMTWECGKVLSESLGEVDYGASFVEWFAEEAKRTYGDVIPAHTKDRRLVVIKQSIGVVAALTPWNFPLAMITRKVGPALAAGSPVIVSPRRKLRLRDLQLLTWQKRPDFRLGYTIPLQLQIVVQLVKNFVRIARCASCLLPDLRRSVRY